MPEMLLVVTCLFLAPPENVHILTLKFLFGNRVELKLETSNPGLLCKVFKEFSRELFKFCTDFMKCFLMST
jgi:hypothetical protein